MSDLEEIKSKCTPSKPELTSMETRIHEMECLLFASDYKHFTAISAKFNECKNDVGRAYDNEPEKESSPEKPMQLDAIKKHEKSINQATYAPPAKCLQYDLFSDYDAADAKDDDLLTNHSDTDLSCPHPTIVEKSIQTHPFRKPRKGRVNGRATQTHACEETDNSDAS